MRYKRTVNARFIERQNRFVATAELGGEILKVHVKNTGRCRELLKKDSIVFLEESDNKDRKTRYDLIAVEKSENAIVNIDSTAPNEAVFEWISRGNMFSPFADVRREVKYGASRFDIYVEDGARRAFIEVKGVTLEENGVAMFPDAPTERGIKHLGELERAASEGYEAYIFFVIQMKGVFKMKPNDKTHKAFGDALRHAAKSGVDILAYDCVVTADTMEIDDRIDIEL